MLSKLYELFLKSQKISTDSRRVEPGSIFFALSGENFDGNRFALSALEKGAAYAVVDKAEYALDKRFMLVDNTLECLQQLATMHRDKLSLPIIAISGSNGKTTTKELLGAVLSQKFRLCITQGNLNNHIGVPLTLLSMNSEHQMAIVEMGASHIGEIKLLCQIAKPNYGLLTNVGRAHLEGFGSEQGVRQAKGELFDYLETNHGKAFYRETDPIINSMVAERVNLDALPYSSERPLPQSKLEGIYNQYNVAAAVAVGEFFEIESIKITAAIENYEPTNNRSQRTDTAKNKLIVDCYNANPSSMESALENLKNITAEHKIAILGDMFELGTFSDSEHTNTLVSLEQVGVERAIVVGENFSKAAKNYSAKGYKLSSYINCEEFIKSESITGALILLKGSRGVALEKLIAYL